MGTPDVIYVVRPGERNDFLRYSLRSLGHLPHNRVFIAGFCPSWVKNVTRVPVTRHVNKFDSIEQNLRAALRHPEIGEHAVYFNDDFYITEPIDEVPPMHGGPADASRYGQEIRIRFVNTIRHLNPMPNPVTYELHVPMPIETGRARVLMSLAPKRILWRTYYGNIAGIGGDATPDVKSHRGDVFPGPFLSSAPKALSSLREYLNERLPHWSAYE